MVIHHMIVPGLQFIWVRFASEVTKVTPPYPFHLIVYPDGFIDASIYIDILILLSLFYWKINLVAGISMWSVWSEVEVMEGESSSILVSLMSKLLRLPMSDFKEFLRASWVEWATEAAVKIGAGERSPNFLLKI